MSNLSEQLLLEIQEIPQHRQTQAPLMDQLDALANIANRFGLYDAADYLIGPTAEERRRQHGLHDDEAVSEVPVSD